MVGDRKFEIFPADCIVNFYNIPVRCIGESILRIFIIRDRELDFLGFAATDEEEEEEKKKYPKMFHAISFCIGDPLSSVT